MSKVSGESGISTLNLKWMCLVRIFSQKNLPSVRGWLKLPALMIMLQAMFVRLILVNFLPSLRLAGIDLTWLTETWQKEIVITVIFIKSHPVPSNNHCGPTAQHWRLAVIRTVWGWTNTFSKSTEWMISSLSPAWIIWLDVCYNVININQDSIGWCCGITGGGGVSLHYYA